MDDSKLFLKWLGIMKQTGHYGHEKMMFSDFHEKNQLPPPPRQMMLLHLIAAHEGITQKELAVLNSTGAAAISGMLSRLEKNDYIERRADQNDRRVFKIYLTEKTRNMKCQMNKAVKDLSAKMFEGFSCEEKEQLEHILNKMEANLDSLKTTGKGVYKC